MYKLFLFIAAVGLPLVFSCKCKQSTTDEVYCQSKWISRVNITAKKLSSDRHTTIYTVNHVEVFKKPDTELGNDVTTPAFSGACGISELRVGETYLIAGTIANGFELRALSCMTFPVPGNDLLGSVAWNNVPQELKLVLKTPPTC